MERTRNHLAKSWFWQVVYTVTSEVHLKSKLDYNIFCHLSTHFISFALTPPTEVQTCTDETETNLIKEDVQ